MRTIQVPQGGLKSAKGKERAARKGMSAWRFQCCLRSVR